MFSIAFQIVEFALFKKKINAEDCFISKYPIDYPVDHHHPVRWEYFGTCIALRGGA